MLTEKNKQNKKGFSLLEMIVVLAIFSIGIVGLASLMLQTMQAESTNAGYLKASMLAQEGLEIVRSMRDENWLNEEATSWDMNFGDTDHTFTVDYAFNTDDVADSILDSEAVLFINGNGFYNATSTGRRTNYSRLITLTDCSPSNPDCWQVNSTVRWTASGKTHTYEADTILYNWR